MSCSHLDEYLEINQNKLAVKNLLAAVVFPTSDAGFKLKSSLLCQKCNEKSFVSDTMVCGCCIFSGCLRFGHFMQHFKECEHCICLSLDLGEVYCMICNDYQYNDYCDNLLHHSRRQYLARLGMLDLAWRPAIRDLPLLRWVRSPRSPDPSRPTRGLVNMGNTCFLNVVVQALTHTPALRDFLLSDEHRCSTAKASRDCLACELVRVAQQLYNGNDYYFSNTIGNGVHNSHSTATNSNNTSSISNSINGRESNSNSYTYNCPPLALTNLLYMIWNHVADLARYDQHDAHELFLAVLSLLHTHLSGDSSNNNNSSKINNSGANSSSHRDPEKLNSNNNNSSRSSSTGIEDDDCDCIVHQAFMATLESKIIYDCGLHVSRHLEVFRDLSLEIFRLDESVSLETSFRSYFGSERMRDAQCSTCHKLGATKQYSLFQLPNIFSVHLKRCHAKSKVNTKVHFPQELDLAPFISNKSADQSLWEDKYSLYSVINHRGQHSAGHYTAYVRTEDNTWCLCDDQHIQLVSLAEVLRSDAYMLFYHKNSLVMKA